MTTQSITVELDQQTVHDLAKLGTLNEVLAQLARSTADDVRRRQPACDHCVRLQDASFDAAQADALVAEQREANEQLVQAVISAQELFDEAASAQERAEASAHELRTVAEFRELFIGILGHDLRNPLGSIVLAGARMLQRGNLDTRDAELAKRIMRGTQRITRMITQLLDLTQARLAGGFPIEPTATDMGDVCRNVAGEFEGKDIRLDLQGDLTGIWDADRVEQVLSNLVGNALTYAAPGTSVSVDARMDGSEIVVAVRNSGEPIPAEVLPYIFEPFRRARPREPSLTGNLGLGLYIAKQIVVSHRGTLDAASHEGTTTFVMRLPRDSAVVELPPSPA